MRIGLRRRGAEDADNSEAAARVGMPVADTSAVQDSTTPAQAAAPAQADGNAQSTTTSRVRAPEGYWEAADRGLKRDAEVYTTKRLLDDWRAEDERKAAEYEQGRQQRSALSNVLSGYEALFNSRNVRAGARYSEGAETDRAKDEQDRFARWAAERERRKDEYARTRTSLADMIKESNDERLMRIKEAAGKRADEELAYKRAEAEREAERKRAEAEGKAVLNAANVDAIQARAEATRNKMRNDDRMTDIRAEQARSSSAANYARAKYYNEGGGRSGKASSGGGSKGVKVVTYGGRKRELPNNVNTSQMESAIIADMVNNGLIEEEEYIRDTDGKALVGADGKRIVKRRKTRAELVAEMNRKWSSRGSNAETIYKRYETKGSGDAGGDAGGADDDDDDFTRYKRSSKGSSTPSPAGAAKKKAPLGAKIK